MTYAKPEVAVLGNAVSVIEHTGVKPYPVSGDGLFIPNPAYDLDE